MTELFQKRRAQGGHRGRTRKILTLVDELAKDIKEENRQQVKKVLLRVKRKNSIH